MKVEVKITGIDDVIAGLRALPPEVVSKRGGPVKMALAKGARLMRDEAKRNLEASIAVNGSDESTGLLLANVISSRGKPPFGGKGERYLVRVRRKQYPTKGVAVAGGKRNRTVAKAGSTLQTANLLEWGSSTQPATPWLRPAVLSKGQQVINVVTQDLVRRIDVLTKKLFRKTR